jgi:hypothetical protein
LREGDLYDDNIFCFIFETMSCYVAQAGLKFNLSASASWVLWLQTRVTLPSDNTFWYLFLVVIESYHKNGKVKYIKIYNNYCHLPFECNVSLRKWSLFDFTDVSTEMILVIPSHTMQCCFDSIHSLSFSFPLHYPPSPLKQSTITNIFSFCMYIYMIYIYVYI